MSTSSRDPLRDRAVPTAGLTARVRIDVRVPDVDETDLLAGFVAIIARYLDNPTVAVAWSTGGRWRPVAVIVDLDAPFAALRVTVRESLADSLAEPDDREPLPAFGVSPGPVPGPGPALLALDAEGGLEFAAAAYDESEVRRFVRHLATLLHGRHGEVAVGRLPIVSTSERDQLAPHESAPPDETTLVDLVAAQVASRPGAEAVRAAGDVLTYAELWRRSGALAVRLPARACVGVWGERTVDLLVGLLAVLRAGSAYVALEPGYPAARLRMVAELADLTVVVAGPGAGADAAAALGLPVLHGESHLPTLDSDPAALHSAAADDLAYVMFTSGSTGVPKGVMVEHRNVVNTLRHLAIEPGLRAGEVMLGVTTPAFDLSVPDLFLPLVTGATLVLADAEAARDAVLLARLLRDHRPDLMQATPSTWRLLCDAGWAGAPGMRVVCGGEAYDAALTRALAARTAGVWNCYGPTETTVWSMATRLTGEEGDPLPLGRPMRGVDCYLLDSRGEPVPPGVRGEIAIAGAGVARGYLDRPDLTAASFVACPFPESASDRMYLTGDLGRIAPDGALRFAGRRDHQVKLNGFRVELGEIESSLQRCPGVHHAVAVVRDDDGPSRIVGYVVGDPDAAPPDPEQTRVAVARLLPPQSVPAVVVALDRLPLTANGKVDRAALPVPGQRVGSPLTGELEPVVAAAFAAVLEMEVRHADDDVFALGADSLLVGRIAIRLTDDLGVDVSPGLVFRHPTVSGLARALLGVLLGDETELLDDLERAHGVAG